MNFFRRIIVYLTSSREEIRKVTWPTREQLIRDTIIVLLISAVLAAYLGGLDYVLTQGLQDVLKFK